MGKKANLVHQAYQNLNASCHFGESKHDAKIAARKAADEKGTPYVREIKGIYSTSTLYSYKKDVKLFISEILPAHPEIKKWDDCREFVKDFLESHEAKGNSAWTLGQYGSAIACAFGCSKNDFGYKYPQRSRRDITRCRNESSSDYRYPQEKWDKARMFIKGTGCRRAEVLRLRKEDFRETGDGNLEVYKRGKGGIERWCLVNPNYTEQIREYLKTAETYEFGGQERLFLKAEIPQGAIHDMRADYACDLYDYYEKRGDVASGKNYVCRKDMKGAVYDKGILEKVSYDLQHSRTNVVVSYLWKRQ